MKTEPNEPTMIDNCPSCGSPLVETTGVITDTNVVTRQSACDVCGQTFEEKFTFTEAYMIREGERQPVTTQRTAAEFLRLLTDCRRGLGHPFVYDFLASRKEHLEDGGAENVLDAFDEDLSDLTDTIAGIRDSLREYREHGTVNNETAGAC